jgi:hypothetical protein
MTCLGAGSTNSAKLELVSSRFVIGETRIFAMDATQERLKAEIAQFNDEQELKRRDLWMFAPLIAVLVAMPLAIVAVVSVGLYVAAQRLDLSLASQSPPVNFTARWPDKNWPTVVPGKPG